MHRSARHGVPPDRRADRAGHHRRDLLHRDERGRRGVRARLHQPRRAQRRAICRPRWPAPASPPSWRRRRDGAGALEQGNEARVAAGKAGVAAIAPTGRCSTRVSLSQTDGQWQMKVQRVRSELLASRSRMSPASAARPSTWRSPSAACSAPTRSSPTRPSPLDTCGASLTDTGVRGIIALVSNAIPGRPQNIRSSTRTGRCRTRLRDRPRHRRRHGRRALLGEPRPRSRRPRSTRWSASVPARRSIAEPAPTPTILSSVACAIAVSGVLPGALGRHRVGGGEADRGGRVGQRAVLVDHRDVPAGQAGDGVRDEATMPRTRRRRGRAARVDATEAWVCSWSALKTLRSGIARLTSRADAGDVLDLGREHLGADALHLHLPLAVGLRQRALVEQRPVGAIAADAGLPAATRASFTLLDGTSTVAPPSPSLVAMPAPASAACRSPALRVSRLVNAASRRPRRRSSRCRR